MDPNETLARIRAAIRHAQLQQHIDDPDAFVTLVEALDEWLGKGGFLPDAWAQPAPSTVGALSANDHILTRAGVDLDDRFALPYTLGVCFYLYPTTPIFVRLHKREHRAVLSFGNVRADLALYLTGDQVDRLAALLAHTRDRLR